jgi:hypothetical protein
MDFRNYLFFTIYIIIIKTSYKKCKNYHKSSQTTDAKILSDLIKTERHVLKKDKKKDDH